MSGTSKYRVDSLSGAAEKRGGKTAVVVIGLAVLIASVSLAWDTDLPRRHLWSAGSIAPADFYASSRVGLAIDGERYSYLPGEVVLRRGERITTTQAAIIEAMRVGDERRPVLVLLGLVLLVLVQTLIAIVWLWGERAKEAGAEGRLVLFVVCITACIVFMKALAVGDVMDGVRILLNPIPAVSILVSIVLGQQFGRVAAIMLSPFHGILFGPSPAGAETVYALIGGLVGALGVSPRRSQRHDIIKVGTVVGIVNVVVSMAYGFVLRHPASLQQLTDVYGTFIPAFFNGVAGAVLAIGIVPLLEGFFKVTTVMKLQELTIPTQPLLQRLIREAPGTYHHSTNVAWLAEMAAKEVGADGLLAKVGALYHDIGKLKRPYFFVENQMGGVNYHDQLSPHLSRLIITSHTKDGVEIGVAAGLPKSVLDIMQQHHGTDMVSYFYHGARQMGDGKSTVDEHSFRYSGPKPQTKEAAVVMLADAVEAATRTIERPGLSAFERVVTKITNDRFLDGQFDECDLTRKEIEIIADRLTALVVSMYHSRVVYPEEDEFLSKSKAPGGSAEEVAAVSKPSQPQSGGGGSSDNRNGKEQP